jgi:hypothetical protein
MTMTSERYAAGDDAFKAVIEHAPSEESTNVSGVVASAGARKPENVTASGRLPEVGANTASSLTGDIDTRKPTVVERTRTARPHGLAKRRGGCVTRRTPRHAGTRS